VITQLPDLQPAAPEPGGAGPDHPMRKVTRQVAFETGSWTSERAKKVEALFDELAPEWASRHSDQRMTPLVDALDRGKVRAESCIELGAGTGPGTSVLCRHFERVVAFDISQEMLRRLKPEWGRRVRADASRLPLRDASADALILMNMLLFPAEVERVLAPKGTLVWVNSRGDQTPIHLSAEEVGRALPGKWSGTTAHAGTGLWCVLRRG
jgi:SAM-dependent methyltransferase